jgi:DNA polymerase III subunit gamma/tau
MSYTVLARKWRPRFFADMIGQRHVIRALTNALESGRIHHAYLFTGTRGVGKTTMARALARALSCEVGISATPCGQCANCVAIDEGRYVDLIEVDAASRTRVDDTRELLDNVQYMPVQGRYKIYLVDEVHMFSLNSFNALLKTLEEPPPHVIFMLATTDPQKLPVTVLSRCLKFNLSRVDDQELAEYFATLLQEEGVNYEDSALGLIARAADGSVRDGLSLLDQIIAYCGATISLDETRSILGTVDEQHLIALLRALVTQDINAILAAAEVIYQTSSNYKTILAELARAFFEISLAKLGAEVATSGWQEEFVSHFNADQLQLYYQIALKARQDLSLAPDYKTGFEMGLIRLLAFSPVDGVEVDAPAVETPTPTPPTTQPALQSWDSMVKTLKASPMVKTLASHCEEVAIEHERIQLRLSSAHANLATDNARKKLTEALAVSLNHPVELIIDIAQTSNTPAKRADAKKKAQYQRAKDAIQQDNHVQDLVETFGASIDEQTISEQTISEQTISEQTMSEQTMSEQTMSEQTMSEQTKAKHINSEKS